MNPQHYALKEVKHNQVALVRMKIKPITQNIQWVNAQKKNLTRSLIINPLKSRIIPCNIITGKTSFWKPYNLNQFTTWWLKPSSNKILRNKSKVCHISQALSLSGWSYRNWRIRLRVIQKMDWFIYLIYILLLLQMLRTKKAFNLLFKRKLILFRKSKNKRIIRLIKGEFLWKLGMAMGDMKD